LGKYRGLKSGAGYNPKGYLTKDDLYRILTQYPILYRSSKYPKPRYRARRSSGRIRSLSRYQPRQQPLRTPAPKYKKISKPNLGFPIKEEPIRYSHQSRIFRTDIDTDQLVNDIEKRLGGKLAKLLVEKLEAEIEEFQQKIESGREDENSAPLEESQKLTEVLEKSGKEQDIAIEGNFEMDEDSFNELVEKLKEQGAEQYSLSEVEQDVCSNGVKLPSESENIVALESSQEGEASEPVGYDHLEAYIIDEGWLDEDGLNTLLFSEPELEQTEQTTELTEETELLLPEIWLESELSERLIEHEGEV